MSVALDELGQAVLGKQIGDGLAEQGLKGGVAVGREAAELAADRGTTSGRTLALRGDGRGRGPTLTTDTERTACKQLSREARWRVCDVA